jgi:hypothetical protein
VILASSDSDVEAEVAAVNVALAQYYDRCDVLDIVPAQEVRSRIEFWLDIPGVPGWTAFGRSDKGVVLIFGEELVLSL